MDDLVNGLTRGGRIRHSRLHPTKGQKMSQTVFGKKAGNVTVGAVSQWENDITVPTAENLFCIEDLTGFSARWLATGKGAPLASDAYMELFEKENELAEKLKTLSQEQLIAITKKFMDYL